MTTAYFSCCGRSAVFIPPYIGGCRKSPLASGGEEGVIVMGGFYYRIPHPKPLYHRTRAIRRTFNDNLYRASDFLQHTSLFIVQLTADNIPYGVYI